MSRSWSTRFRWMALALRAMLECTGSFGAANCVADGISRVSRFGTYGRDTVRGLGYLMRRRVASTASIPCSDSRDLSAMSRSPPGTAVFPVVMAPAEYRLVLLAARSPRELCIPCATTRSRPDRSIAYRDRYKTKITDACSEGGGNRATNRPPRQHDDGVDTYGTTPKNLKLSDNAETETKTLVLRTPGFWSTSFLVVFFH